MGSPINHFKIGCKDSLIVNTLYSDLFEWKILFVALITGLLIGSSVVLAHPSVPAEAKGTMKIKLTSVFVKDQMQALKFYTETLGFIKKKDFSVGEFRWLTVVSAEDPDGTELLLEPNANEAARTFQAAIFEQGIPAASFSVEEVEKEYARLLALGVKFTVKPLDVGTAIIAVFDDTCGNLIQIAQE